ncbi:hypothetical protein KUTeg_020052 [Tegillarca granosa]|uniref:Protein kinase domain-containing protein n=1 Tax=Tegillarca granosa TaxID=220873 RepID=A0ABQ9EC78_TEGGR|nr:hypothetical protein KUTeg_020052 [Tegillarca granosa]
MIPPIMPILQVPLLLEKYTLTLLKCFKNDNICHVKQILYIKRLFWTLRLFSQVLKRSMYSLKVAKIMDAKSMKSNQDMISDLHKRLEQLVVNSRQCIENLHKDFLQSTDCLQLDDWKKIAREASERVASCIAFDINIWERTNGIMYSIKEKIVKKSKQEFALMEDQIKSIEAVKSMLKRNGIISIYVLHVFCLGNTRVISDLHKSIKLQHPLKKLFKKAKHYADHEEDSFQGIGGAFVSFGLGGAFVSVGEFDIQNKNVKKLFSGYKKQNKKKPERKSKNNTLVNLSKELIMLPKLSQSSLKQTDNLFKLLRKNLLVKWRFICLYRDTKGFSKVTKLLQINVMTVLSELEHENIVKYYGSTCRQVNDYRVEWIMITELCDGNLKDLVIGNKSFQNPSKF